VWARHLFKQVVAEYTGQALGAPAHSPLQADESGKSGKGDAEKEGETRLSV